MYKYSERSNDAISYVLLTPKDDTFISACDFI